MRKLLSANFFGLWISLALIAGCDQAGTPRSSNPQQAKRNAEATSAPAATKPPATETAELAATEPAPIVAREQPAAEAESAETASAEAAPPALAAKPVQKFADPEASSLQMPGVVLSHAQSELCRIKVGDKLPDVELPDLDGETKQLGKLLGSKLTVVVFWGGASRTSIQELGDLGTSVVKRFGSFGVAAVGIDVGDEATQARALAKRAGAAFPLLADSDGAALRSIGPPRPPATYLVDGSLKVLWFDIEYSNTTRRDLERAIRYALAHE